MKTKKRIGAIPRCAVSIMLLLSGGARLLARPGSEASGRKAYRMDSGKHEGLAGKGRAAYRDVVVAAGASSLRLHFGDYNLGANSFIRITSLKDGAQQHLNAKSMASYRGGSAYFNGESVEVELNVGPGDKNIFFQMEQVTTGEMAGGDVGILTLCDDDDDRVGTTDPAIARILIDKDGELLAKCTAYIIQNGALLTAGHCFATACDLIEFNVPSSLNDGTIQHPDPSSQYTIDDVLKGPGADTNSQDYAIFTCYPNSETERLPLEAQQAFYRIVKDDLFPTEVRVTGYGLDKTPAGDGPDGENSDNRTLQTDSGAFLGEYDANDPDTDWWGKIIKYTADTTGGNSGSPVERVLASYSKVSMGIHTEGKCENPNYLYNWGTGFDNEHFVDYLALTRFTPPNTVYVDKGHPSILETGTIWDPALTFWGALAIANPYDTLVIAGGSYGGPPPFTVGQNVTLSAAGGSVILGQ